MVSAQYMRKYLTYLYEIFYTEAPRQNEDQDELYLIFKVSKAIRNGFRSISEELFVVSSPNLVHRSTRARRRPSDLDQLFKVTKVIYVRVFLLNILGNVSLTKFRTGTQRGKE